MTQTISINPELLIGRGRDRACYRHPDDPDFCIKVGTKPEKQTRREKRYFLYLLRKGVDMRFIAPYMGDIKTSQGTGALFPLIHDDNGEVSLTLTQTIKANQIDRGTLNRKLDQLYRYLVDNHICTRDVSPNNIMVRRRAGQIDFILIDGVSRPNLNPLSIRLPALAKRSVDKCWVSLMQKVNKLTTASVVPLHAA